MSRGLWLRLSLDWLLVRRIAAEPGHVLAQLGADLLDRLRQVLIPHALIFGLSSLALGDPLACEGAALNIGQHFLHASAGLVVDDARARNEVAILCRLGDEGQHLLEAALVH